MMRWRRLLSTEKPTEGTIAEDTTTAVARVAKMRGVGVHIVIHGFVRMGEERV